MRARAAIGVVRTKGGSRCEVLRSDAPFTFRETPAGLAWVGTAAGPIGGDDLGLRIDVGAGADLVIGSVAASLVHPGPDGRSSRTAISARIGAGASLRWQPRASVLVRGSDHRSETVIVLDADADLLWREEVVLGRHGEGSGSLHQRLVIDAAGAPLLRTELAVGPRWPGSLGPAGTAGARAVGTLVLVGMPVAPVSAPPGVQLAVQPLAAGAVLVSAVADRPGALGVALDAVVAASVEASRSVSVGRGGPCCSSASSSPPASSPLSWS